jgi:hypothetical protein
MCLAGCVEHGAHGQANPLERVRERFGRVGVGVVGHASFFGDVGGLSSGTGVVVDIPPLVPINTVSYLGWAAMAQGAPSFLEELREQTLTAEAVQSGVTFPYRRYVSEFSLDLSVSDTAHRDESFGGELDYTGVMIGVRLGGPRYRVPRYYVCGGFGWFDFDYDNRPDAGVPGPYVGAGLEVFPRENLSLALDWRGHFYFGEDDAGAPVDGGASQTSLVFSWYW